MSRRLTLSAQPGAPREPMNALSLRRLVSVIGLVVAIITAVSIPLVYLAVGYTNASSLLDFKARLSASHVARYADGHSTYWQYQSVLLSELFDKTETGKDTRKRITDSSGKVVLERGPDLAGPILTRGAPITVAGSDIGRVEIGVSLRTMLRETAIVTFFSLLLGLAMFFAACVFPLRVLDKTLGTLQRTNDRFDAALSNMAQGLCMFDADLRLVASNQHYLDLFKLPARIAKPGVSLREMITHSVSAGRHPGQTVDELMDQRLAIIGKGEAATMRTRVDGTRTIQIVYRPMADGGWVATYEDITERELAEEALAEQNRRFHAALNNMPHGLGMFDGQKRLIVCNRQFAEMYRFPESLAQPGATLDQIVDYRVATGQGPLDLETFQRELKKHSTDGTATNYKLYLQDGRIIQINYEPMDGGGWVTTHQDVTDRERADEALAEQNRRFDAALNNMSQGLVMFNTQKRLIVCNRRYAEMYRLPENLTQAGTSLDEILDYRVSTRQGPLDLEGYKRDQERRTTDGKSVSYKLELQDGRILQIDSEHMTGGGWVATHDDITEREAAQAKISHMALHDGLTGLPNRLYFSEQLERRFAHMDRDERFAVLCFDLDRFKSVNDSLGHAFGDKLLRQVGERIRACLREGDMLARLGGDEFAVLQGGVKHLTEINALASRLIEVISNPYDLDGQQAVVGVSIGIAVAPADAARPDELLKNADMALYRAKSDGRGTSRFFEPEMDARMQKRRALELDLRKALIHGEFELYYQPIVKLDDDAICGFEALLRWNHPERGLVPPMEFISLAEETELIIPIGEWVLRQACKEAASWPTDIGVAVNISPVQFKMRNLAQMVINALASSGLPAQRLELEITESVLLFKNESTLETLHQLRDLGVRISMDDFGTGYSSLSYLRSFPFDKIKIDRSFVHGATSIQDSMAIIRAVTGLGTSLGMTTTGEGVETKEELEYLRKEGCTQAQGYFFSQPKPASEIRNMLSKQTPASKAVA